MKISAVKHAIVIAGRKGWHDSHSPKHGIVSFGSSRFPIYILRPTSSPWHVTLVSGRSIRRDSHPACLAPLLQPGDEFFGVRPINHATGFCAERANRVD